MLGHFYRFDARLIFTIFSGTSISFSTSSTRKSEIDAIIQQSRNIIDNSTAQQAGYRESDAQKQSIARKSISNNSITWRLNTGVAKFKCRVETDLSQWTSEMSPKKKLKTCMR